VAMHGHRYGRTEKINPGRSLPIIPVDIRPEWRACVANKWVIGDSVRFRAFGGYRIVPNFTDFYQKRAANELEQAVKGQLKGGFQGQFY